MVPAELGAIVSRPFLAEQEGGPGMVEVRVVQNHQARIVQRVGPLIIVVRRIAELVDHQVIGRETPSPHEVVRCRFRVLIDIVAPLREGVDQLGTASRDPCSNRRKRAEPC